MFSVSVSNLSDFEVECEFGYDIIMSHFRAYVGPRGYLCCEHHGAAPFSWETRAKSWENSFLVPN